MEERMLEFAGSPPPGALDLPGQDNLGAIREQIQGIHSAFTRIVSQVMSRDSQRFVAATRQVGGQ